MPRPFHVLLMLVLLASPHPRRAAAADAPGDLRNRDDFGRWMLALSNWGRWGPGDELGALNLVTPAKRLAALALVREGVSVSLARDVEKAKAEDNGSPFQHLMDRAGTNNPGYSVADTFRVSYHGMAHTHLDSLCHMFHEGRMYNGYSQTEVLSDGAHRLGVQNLKSGILTRAVLVDLPLLKGVDFLEPGSAILPADLDAWERTQGIRVTPGDVVLIRTGRWARRAARGPWSGSFAGLHGSCARWLKERDVAVLGSDAASDVLPSGVDGVMMPLHQLCIVAMGTWILDNCDLEAVSVAARKRGRWEFLLTLAPLAVPGGTGSPVNPIATF
ncbi:MAG: cyclase family protein [Verrucomicrobiales bacterium]|nr:cyclase family protein [Verrucomicrobiales bacterium]